MDHDVENGEQLWEPYTPMFLNEPTRVTTSIDPHLDLIVDDDKRVNITSKSIDNYENALNAHRLIEFHKRQCAKRLEQMEHDYEEELEELSARHTRRKIKICGDSQKVIDLIFKITKYEPLRVNQLLHAANKIGNFTTIGTNMTCTMCTEDIKNGTMALSLRTCGCTFHLADECVCLLLSKLHCPNCRKSYVLQFD